MGCSGRTHDGIRAPVAAVGTIEHMDAGPNEPLADAQSFTCPRCGGAANERFYGPCTGCRDALRAAFVREARVVELAEYEPKMNVTPNAVALKDD